MTRRTVAIPPFRVDLQAPGTLQQRIYGSIRGAILDGVVKPGTRLPSSRDLARDLGISRTTAVLALEQLLAEGYLATRRGSGTFVAEQLPDDLPRARAIRPISKPTHPPLSRRGAALAASPQGSVRLEGPPRPFRVGTPGLDLFPVRLWSRLVRGKLRAISVTHMDYGEVAGLRALREAIADHVQAVRGTRCTADQVIVVAGAQQGLDLTCRLLLDPGDHVWMEEPGYPGARSALLAAGARINPARVDSEGLDVDAAKRQAGSARLAYVTPSHQYPLGVPMSLPRRLALLGWARAAGAWVVEDDYDSEFRYGSHPVPCLHGLDTDGRVIYVGSFSKTLFPALRMGFLIVPADLQERFVAARRAADQHPPVIDQAVLAEFIAEGHFARHLRRMRAAYRERLEALADAAERCCGGVLSLRPVRTGLHAVAELTGVDAVRVASEAASRGVEAIPLAVYFTRAARVLNGLVLGFAAVPPDALRAGMEQLAAAIDAARPRR
ncbi:MAG TPA: PLP-dependent aminotransferase family protein [Gemmatimonadales bacterium]|nr:PLP-dependent aminotransferase family protein [Gemmatimonadales bacterium]